MSWASPQSPQTDVEGNFLLFENPNLYQYLAVSVTLTGANNILYFNAYSYIHVGDTGDLLFVAKQVQWIKPQATESQPGSESVHITREKYAQKHVRSRM